LRPAIGCAPHSHPPALATRRAIANKNEGEHNAHVITVGSVVKVPLQSFQLLVASQGHADSGKPVKKVGCKMPAMARPARPSH
jgi:hypothetical protein